MVHKGGIDSRAGGDPADRGPVEARGGELLAGGREDRAAGVAVAGAPAAVAGGTMRRPPFLVPAHVLAAQLAGVFSGPCPSVLSGATLIFFGHGRGALFAVQLLVAGVLAEALSGEQGGDTPRKAAIAAA